MAFGCHEDEPSFCMIHWGYTRARVLSVHAIDVFSYLLTGCYQKERQMAEGVGTAHAEPSYIICLLPES